MRKTYLFSIIFMVLWAASILFILPEISAFNKRGVRVVEVIFIIAILSVSFTISAIGIAFRCNWARHLHIYTTILGFIVIVGGIGYSMVTQKIEEPIIFIYAITSFWPWIVLFLYGLYYLNRKDVIASFNGSE